MASTLATANLKKTGEAQYIETAEPNITDIEDSWIAAEGEDQVNLPRPPLSQVWRYSSSPSVPQVHPFVYLLAFTAGISGFLCEFFPRSSGVFRTLIDVHYTDG